MQRGSRAFSCASERRPVHSSDQCLESSYELYPPVIWSGQRIAVSRYYRDWNELECLEKISLSSMREWINYRHKIVFFCLVTARTNISLADTRQIWLINQRRVAFNYRRTNLQSERDVRSDTSGFQWLTSVLLRESVDIDTLQSIETKDSFISEENVLCRYVSKMKRGEPDRTVSPTSRWEKRKRNHCRYHRCW